MWPWRRGRESKSSPIPVWTPGDQWRSVPPIQRLVPDHPLVNPVSRFTSSLASWQNPSLLAPLGHSVDAAGPSGVVSDLWPRAVSTVTGSGPVVRRAVASPEAVPEVEVRPAEPTAESAVEAVAGPAGRSSVESTVDPVPEPVVPEVVIPGPVPGVPSPAAAEVDVRPRELPVVRDAPAPPSTSVQRIEELGLPEPAPVPALEPSTTDEVAELLGVCQDDPRDEPETQQAPELPQATESGQAREPGPPDPVPDLPTPGPPVADRPNASPERPAPGPVAQRAMDTPPPVRKLGLGAPIVSSAPGTPPPVVPAEPVMPTVHSDPVQRSVEAPRVSRPAEAVLEHPLPQPAELPPPAVPVTKQATPPVVVSRLVGDRSPVAVEHAASTVHTEQSEPGIIDPPSPVVPTVSRVSTTETPPVLARPDSAIPNPVTVSRTVVGLGVPSVAAAPLPIQRSSHVPSVSGSAPHLAAPSVVPSPTVIAAPEMPPVVQRQDSDPAPTDVAVPEVPAAAPESPPPEAAAPAPPSATAAAPAAPGTPGAPGAPGAPGQAGQEPEELLKKLFDPLLRRLKTELRLDRERRGALTDRWH